MQEDFHSRGVSVAIDMLYPPGVEAARPSDNPVNFITLYTLASYEGEQYLGSQFKTGIALDLITWSLELPQSMRQRS